MVKLFEEVQWGTGGTDYPPELLKNMRPDDEVVAFIRIETKERGCLSKKVKSTGNKSFIAITRERVVGTVEEVEGSEGVVNKNKVEKVRTINIPLVKITSIYTSNSKMTEKSGCLSKTKKRTECTLTINAQGKPIEFYTGPDSTVNDEFVRSFLEISDYF